MTSDRTFANQGEKSLELGLSQEFETGGKRGARVRLAEVGIERTRLAVLERERTLAGEVRAAFYNLYYLQQRQALSRQAMEISSFSASTAEERFRHGDIAEIEVRLARVAYQKRVAEAAGVSGELAAAQPALAVLMGASAASVRDVSGQWTLAVALPADSELLATARSARPDLRQRLLEVDSASAEEKLARASRSPDVKIGIGYSKQKSIFDAQAGVPSLQDSDQLATLRFTVPLPIVNRRVGEIRKARAAAEVAKASVESLSQGIQRQVLEARRRLARAAERYRINREKLVPLATENLELNRQAYRAGESDVLQMLKAQDDLNDAKVGQLEAAWEYEQAWSALQTALNRR